MFSFFLISKFSDYDYNVNKKYMNKVLQRKRIRKVTRI